MMMKKTLLILTIIFVSQSALQAQLRVLTNNNVVVGSTTETTNARQYIFNSTRAISLDIDNQSTTSGHKYGIYNEIVNGISHKTGLRNVVTHPSNGLSNVQMIGFLNNMYFGPAGGSGTYNNLYGGDNTSLTNSFGTYNYISLGSSGSKYQGQVSGIYNEVLGWHVTNSIFGSRNYVLPKYGDSTNFAGYFYLEGSNLPSNDTAAQYGIYASVNGAPNGYAGYFVGDVTITGTLVHGSDKELKKDIRDLEGALTLIRQMQPKKYKYQRSTSFSLKDDRDHFGFLAQDLARVLPELVYTVQHPGQPRPPREQTFEEEPEPDTGSFLGATTTFQAVDYNALIAVLIQGMKEQQQVIENLTRRVEELEKKQ